MAIQSQFTVPVHLGTVYKYYTIFNPTMIIINKSSRYARTEFSLISSSFIAEKPQPMQMRRNEKIPTDEHRDKNTQPVGRDKIEYRFDFIAHLI